MYPDALSQLLLIIATQQRDTGLFQHLFQQQVTPLTFRCLMGTVVQLHCRNDSPGAVRDNHIAMPLRYQAEQLPPFTAPGLTIGRHSDDIGHTNLRAQPPLAGIGHPVEPAQKTLLPSRHQLTGTDE
ncbi:hypothetical protein A3462_05610 [Enterobacter bugandensis]|nr:hypothetical protein A3462_05610 [Enterobacter bugandensis]